MAVVWAVEKLRTFLIGNNFTIYTDRQAIVYMKAAKTKVLQIARWMEYIQEYDFSIHH